jgi:hypothetical protein
MSLVGFYGYLLFEDEKIIVVECVPNGNLRQHLDGTFFSHHLFLCLFLCVFDSLWELFEVESTKKRAPT